MGFRYRFGFYIITSRLVVCLHLAGVEDVGPPFCCKFALGLSGADLWAACLFVPLLFPSPMLLCCDLVRGLLTSCVRGCWFVDNVSMSALPMHGGWIDGWLAVEITPDSRPVCIYDSGLYFREVLAGIFLG